MKIILLLMSLLSASLLHSQENSVSDSDSADVSSIDNIIYAYYGITSGPAGERDWVRYRNLFQPEAQINARVFAQDGKLQYVSGTMEDFISQVDEYFTASGIFEEEIGRSMHLYRDVAHVFSAYETRLAANEKPYHRGVKSMQLVYDQDRWWIVNILYNNESSKDPIPEELLFEEYRE